MVQTIHELAFAKINLTLDITGKRKDGYHTLDSIMQTVTLADTITLTYESDRSDLSFFCDEPTLSVSDNLCLKAARAFFEAAKLKGGAVITLAKRIPIAAGLGGGSADAAAVLRALEQIFPDKLAKEELFTLSAQLGADVPFCYTGGCVRARGIGDNMERMPQMPVLPIVIAQRGEGISAAEAYRLYDVNPTPDFHTEKATEALRNKDTDALLRSMANNFERVIFLLHPEAKRLCGELRALGALTAHMSGSGSAVFGFFSCEKDAVKATAILRKHGAFAEVCYPCIIQSAQN